MISYKDLRVVAHSYAHNGGATMIYRVEDNDYPMVDSGYFVVDEEREKPLHYFNENEYKAALYYAAGYDKRDEL